MKKHTPILFLIIFFSSCQAQVEQKKPSKTVGGGCEGCDAVFEYADIKLSSTATLPAYQENNPKLKLSGTVFQKDGKTPAPNVILYIYHTNRNGIYEKKGNEEGWAKRHGFIRGWIKTGANGKYEFYTFRPASYPNGRESEHIHITVKEPDKNAYYIDDYVFEDDPLLTKEKRNRLKKRGGSGICQPKLDDDIYIIERDIVLGLNIPNYE